MKRSSLYYLACLLLVAACTPAARSSGTSAGEVLTVYAAASLSDVFNQLGEQFQIAHPGVQVIFNFAASQQLAQQIVQGAPADLFASAARQPVETTIQAGEITQDDLYLFAINRLVVALPPGNPAGLKTISDLARPEIKLLLADPNVPAGQYAREFLEKAALSPNYGPAYRDKTLRNVVSYEESVRAVLSKVILGEADAGIVYLTDLSAAGVESVGQLEIPASLNVEAGYYIAPLNKTPKIELAWSFIDFIASPAGQTILAEYGFESLP